MLGIKQSYTCVYIFVCIYVYTYMYIYLQKIKYMEAQCRMATHVHLTEYNV